MNKDDSVVSIKLDSINQSNYNSRINIKPEVQRVLDTCQQKGKTYSWLQKELKNSFNQLTKE
jgi:Leu/Phe-tRNA-protein transferase